MLSWLRHLVPTWVWAAILGLAAAGALGWWGVNAWEMLITEREAAAQRLEALEANRDRWQRRTMDVLEQLRQERERARQAEAAVAGLQADLEELDADYAPVRRRVHQAPPEDDGPVAPVLRQALEELPHAD